MVTTDPTASQTVEVSAECSTVYALLTDLTAFAEIAEETTGMVWRRGSSAAPGAVFTGRNRNGFYRWSTRCTVTDAVPGRMFAFEVDMPLPGTRIARWQYDIVASEGGCRVTESTWDRRSKAFAVVGGLATGTKDRDAANRLHIDATLTRLKARAEAR